MTAKKKNSEIEKIEPQSLAVVAPTAAELAIAFDGNDGLQVPVGVVLPIVKILRESPKFEMPDGNMVESFRGHILHYHSVNQLYLKEYGPDSGGQPPDCSSVDGLVPCNGAFHRFNVSQSNYEEICKDNNAPLEVAALDPVHPVAQVFLNQLYEQAGGTPVGKMSLVTIEQCDLCPAAQFGSKKIGDNGKACQNSIWLYILIDGYRLPVFLKAGPSSLNRKDSLIPFLSNAPNIGAGGMYQTISVQFSLFTKDFASGFKASCLKLSDPKVLDVGKPEDVERLNFLIGLYKSFKEKYLNAMKNFVATDKNEEAATVDTDGAAF